MKTSFSSIFFLTSLSLPMLVKGSRQIRGEAGKDTLQRSGRKLKSSKDDDDDDKKSKDDKKSEAGAGQENVCRDIPIRVRTDDSQVNFATLYTGLYMWGDTTTLNPTKLCDAYIATYDYLTDCGSIPGAYRQVAECELLANAVGPVTDDPNADAFLLKLTYFSNVVHGAMLYHFDDPDPSCYCDRCPGLPSFPGIYTTDDAGPICTCYCDIFSDSLVNTACTCRAPKIETFIDVLNVAYQSKDFHFLDARQLTIDRECDNPTSTSTFDDTLLCPGRQDTLLLNLFTEEPSAAPTVSSAPSQVPSAAPSPYPSPFFFG